MIKLIQKFQFFFKKKPIYRKPGEDEIYMVTFRYNKTLKDLELYDKGKLKELDNPSHFRGLQNYLQTRV